MQDNQTKDISAEFLKTIMANQSQFAKDLASNQGGNYYDQPQFWDDKAIALIIETARQLHERVMTKQTPGLDSAPGDPTDTIRTFRTREAISAIQWQPGRTFKGMIGEVPAQKLANFGEFPAYALLFDGARYCVALPGEWVLFNRNGVPCEVRAGMYNYEDVTPAPAERVTLVPNEHSFVGFSPAPR